MRITRPGQVRQHIQQRQCRDPYPDQRLFDLGVRPAVQAGDQAAKSLVRFAQGLGSDTSMSACSIARQKPAT